MEARKRIKATASRMPPARELLRLVLVSPLRVYFRYAPSRRGKDFAWSRLASHVHWLERAVDVRTTFGAALHVDPADTVGRYVYYFGVWEPNLTAWLSRYLRRGDVFIDVGANIGYFSLLASKLVGPGGGVVAIEPLSAVHDVLRANITANDARNIRPVRSAAWDVEEVVPLFTEPDGQLGMTTAYPTWGSRSELAPAEMVAGRPLAALLKAEELSRARVIKIDAEGAEWRALNGLRPALSSLREDVAIVVELSSASLVEESVSFGDVVGLFAEHGFHAYLLPNDYAASAYYARGVPARPARLRERPDQLAQVDLVFSRSSADFL